MELFGKLLIEEQMKL